MPAVVEEVYLSGWDDVGASVCGMMWGIGIPASNCRALMSCFDAVAIDIEFARGDTDRCCCTIRSMLLELQCRCASLFGLRDG
jgi:hypothetical protein